jgi:prepilin-type N-terminal cleavage/methylation domain-containing protein/prepilin-type processing-associated H-X9-DG protein
MLKNRAFTLIELLVVIAILAILISIILPALHMAKKKGAATSCMANAKNLSLGWYMYQLDNSGRIMSAKMEAQENGRMVGWIGWPRELDGTRLPDNAIWQASPVTDEHETQGIKRGVLYPYVKSPKAYHCPRDELKSKYDGTPHFVSYGLAACLYGYERGEERYDRQIRNHNQIISPALRYNFVEVADMRNWNMEGRFIFGAPEYTGQSEWMWWKPMAVNHGDSGILGFCDGHAEVHKWRDPYTIDRVMRLIRDNVDNYGTAAPPLDQQSDIRYMAQGWAYRFEQNNR